MLLFLTAERLNRATTLALRALVGQLIVELDPHSALAATIRGEGKPARQAAPAGAAPGPWDMRQELGPVDRVVMLSRPLQRPIPLRAQPPAHDKPTGLWYSVGPAWLDYCREVLPQLEREHHYRLTLDRSRLVVINSVAELDTFAKEFRGEGGVGHPSHWIDWRKVAASGQGGIEVAPYLGWAGRRCTWNYSWDVPSGVVWDDKVILGAELIPRQAPFAAYVAPVEDEA